MYARQCIARRSPVSHSAFCSCRPPGPDSNHFIKISCWKVTQITPQEPTTELEMAINFAAIAAYAIRGKHGCAGLMLMTGTGEEGAGEREREMVLR